MRLFLIFSFLSILSIFPSELFYVNAKFDVRGLAYLSNTTIIDKVYPGDKVDVLYVEENYSEEDETGDWAKIRLKNKKEGFIPSKYLQKEPVETKRLRSVVRDRFEPKTFYVLAGVLNIRTEPNISASVITSVPKKTELIVTRFSNNDDFIDGKAAKWAFVKYGEDTEGWVFGAYISEEKDKKSEVYDEDPDHILSGKSKYVRPGLLHLRDEPGKYGSVIGVVPGGESVEILERLTEFETITGNRSIWVKIGYENRQGWVFGAFLSSKKGYTLAEDYIDKPFFYPIDPELSRPSSEYGGRIHPINKTQSFHTGLDLAAPTGTPILAAGDGVIHIANDGKTGYGRLIVIKHDNGLYTYYAHQSEFLKKLNERVKAGDIIGKVGTTGASTGPHLHFEVRTGYGEAHMNPDNYIPRPE